ncbi:urease accessory protein UreD [Bradyrhizobium sp. CB2312]|uniref:urease accessory protein UreD n=1 Tax=Bradyrhizobium sp. CB2312 TaxID=3039155 RepID=UPI0024B27BC7|nr:urease accessory protein UreD [Bradyrhizobium sp. CB2312]WFU74892.1 urease accessory protein UreD [Bradyrhizobium sp. CB2312]
MFSGAANGTEVVDVYQKFPVAVAFPNADEGRCKEAVLINSSGGVAGGDEIRVEVVAEGTASVAVTTQAAEKIYRALDRPARILTRLRADGNARLAWLPQETIVFNRARIVRQTEIDVSSGAELIALEWLVLGRIESGEEVLGGLVQDSWRIRVDGRLVWADGFLASDSTFPQLSRTALLSNWRAIATMIYFGPRPEGRLERLREIGASLECAYGVTIVGAIIVIRVAAIASVDLRRGLRRFLDQLGHELGSGPFGVPKMWSC